LEEVEAVEAVESDKDGLRSSSKESAIDVDLEISLAISRMDRPLILPNT